MTAMTQDQILKEFARQVHLCSGIGRDAMLRIVVAQFGLPADLAMGIQVERKRCIDIIDHCRVAESHTDLRSIRNWIQSGDGVPVE